VGDPLALLLPAPKQATLLPDLCFGEVSVVDPPSAIKDAPALSRAVKLLAGHSREADPLRLIFKPSELGGSEEAYEIHGSGTRLLVSASSDAGFRHALNTIAQWAELHSSATPLRGLSVKDEPDLPQRGVMLDISRDRVPTLATAMQLVELLASWKINQLQLYTEHTFAYSGAEAVWGAASPWTADEIQALDQHAALHGVELIPNQQSFGHLHRWLTHSPYQHLAEVPEGVQHPFHPNKQPFSLCPTDPASLSFLASLYDELLPNFRSQTLNVGLDETFDLGLGRSKGEVAARGLPAVYIDFLLAVHGLVSERGHKMQFWADIILNHPEALERLPESCEPVLWGYEADHPLDAEAATLREAGVQYLIAPGTSSWQSFGGRTDNCLANLRGASKAARAHSSEGMLITDWGDRGHMQPLPVSYLGFLHGAEAAWNGALAEERGDAELAALLDHHAFRDPDGGLGAFALALGRASEPCGVSAHNASALFFPIGFPELSLPAERAPGLDLAAFQAGRDRLQELQGHLSSLAPSSAEAQLAHSELTLAKDMLDCSCELGLARAEAAPGAALAELSGARCAPIAEQLRELGERHAALWLVRSRPGGLADSVARLHGIAELLPST